MFSSSLLSLSWSSSSPILCLMFLMVVSIGKWFSVVIKGLEECPKWAALKEVLEEIEVDCRSDDQEFGSVRILVVAHDDRTCNQIKSVSGFRHIFIKKELYTFIYLEVHSMNIVFLFNNYLIDWYICRIVAIFNRIVVVCVTLTLLLFYK